MRIPGTNQYYVYITCNARKNVLYVGVTNDLNRRVHEHKNKIVKGFSSKYNADTLVYHESFDSIILAINREKQIKSFGKKKKHQLIESMNPDWNALL